MDLGKLKEALAGTFKKRETSLPTRIEWSSSGMEKIQSHWGRYLRKEENRRSSEIHRVNPSSLEPKT
jgi:hypothetical protein